MDLCQWTKKNEPRIVILVVLDRPRASVKFIINPNRRTVASNVIVEIAVDAKRGYIPSMVMFIF